MKNKISKVIYIIMLTILFAGLLVFASQQKSFWEDEVFTSNYASRSQDELASMAAWDVHPPMYLYMVRWWGQRYGFDEIGLRSLSILFAIVALLLTYKLSLDLLGARTALVAITLTAIMPLLVMYGHNARYYSLAAALALFVAFTMYRFTRPIQILFLLFYVASGTAFLYLIYAAASVLIAGNLWWLIRWLTKKETRSFWSLLMWLAAQVAIVLLYLPGLRQLFTVTGRFSQLVAVQNWMVEIVKRAGYFGFVSSVGETISPLNPLAWLGVVTVIGLGIYAITKNWKNLNFWLPITFFFMIAGINLAVTFNTEVSESWQNVSYRALYAFPFFMIWLSAGITSLKPRYAWVVGGILCMVYAVGIFNYFTNRQFLRPVYSVPWQLIFRQVRAEASPDALVVCGYGDSSCYYYATQAGFYDNNLGNWANLIKMDYPEVWFVQTNLGRDEDYKPKQLAILTEISTRYPAQEIYNYAKQDPRIRWLKGLLTDQDDYEYRVNVIRFYKP